MLIIHKFLTTLINGRRIPGYKPLSIRLLKDFVRSWQLHIGGSDILYVFAIVVFPAEKVDFGKILSQSKPVEGRDF